MNPKNKFQTDFLFTNSNFLTGAATVFNLTGNFYDYNMSNTPQEADCKAIGNDFKMVGADLNIAMQVISEPVEY